MSGVAGAFLCPPRIPSATVYERLEHIVSKLTLRGQAGVGVAAFMYKRGIRYATALPSSRASVRIEPIEQESSFRPHVAIAQIHARSRSNGNLRLIKSNEGVSHHLAISLDGALVNAAELQGELFGQGQPLVPDSDAEILLQWIERSCEQKYWRHSLPTNYEAVFRELDGRIDGAISALVLDHEGNLVAYRSQSGLRPLETMRTSDGFLLFASEDSAFTAFEGTTQQLSPGHIQYVDGQTGRSRDHSVSNGRYTAKLCAYETLYLGSSDTTIQGQSHFKTRYNIGVALGGPVSQRLQTESCSTPIIVSSMPRTGGPYADGLFASLAGHNVFAERREVIATRFVERTLIGTLEERQSRIAQKYRVSEPDLSRKTIIMVDEALIRGDTSRAVTRMLLAAGATAVHWAIGSPPIVAPNYYGIGIDTLEELVFWQTWKRLPPEKRAQSLRFHRMKPEVLRSIEDSMAACINAATLSYLPFQLLVSLLAHRLAGFDLSPFTFNMPTPAGQQRADRNLRALVGSTACLNSIEREV
ncbi:hypothetical protein [Bradyrhizobium sp. CCBAU 11361]|uniref:hypothetical protein n=1 Tax=Bradyrhizobium sp. CCBAU 11361 TaxID=1630812 RepID=UPI0023027967|nr:hypothetical protein [Bradyrhizobium sp. CCBAU 11361]